MFSKKFDDYNVLLASHSKRRHELLKQMGVKFKIIDQSINKLKKNDLLITCDTIVWHKNNALGKPNSRKEAFDMIKSLENTSHVVISSICISTIKSQVLVSDRTTVYFDNLCKDDLLYYTENSDVLDRAGSYGIQDYIGHIGIKKIEGSYSNVLGFPTNLFVKTINSMNL